ncbi:MAG: hypothetical protein ACE37F_20350 [Nannocystaceae bacterium]|nr:hypothetical protein [bacterium]
MKRTCLLSTAAILATLTTSSVAMADTKPAIIWVPTADVEATPSGTVDSHCQKTGMSGSGIAAGCLPNVAEPTTLSPSDAAQDIADGIAAAYAAYDLRVVTEAPPEYVPVYALFTGAEASKENNSHTCTSSLSNCAALSRDVAYFAFLDGTNQCSDPDAVTAGVFATGLLAGLEGKDGAASDWMNYPPDFANPPTEFVDECGAIAAPLGGKDGMTAQPLDCTSLDHTGCEGGEQNSHADLIENLGPNAADDQPPIITLVSPADGDVIAEGDPLNATARIEEGSNYAAVRITIASDALEGAVAGGEFSFCTTDICDRNFLDGDPFKTVDTEWTSGDIADLPGGEYIVTVEASDYYGNEAETVQVTVTVEGGPIDPTDGDTDGGDSDGPTTDSNGSDPTGNDTFVTTDGDSDSDSDGDTDGGDDSGAGGDDGGGGCSVSSEQGVGGTIALMLGLLGLGFIRREA